MINVNLFQKVRPLSCSTGWTKMMGVQKISYDEIAEKTMDIQDAHWDVYIDFGEWAFIEFVVMPVLKLLHLDQGLHNPMGTDAVLTDWAFVQLCNRLGIPIAYARKCIEGGEPELLKKNVDVWKGKDGSRSLVRLIANERGIPLARGILSDKYVCFDADEIVREIGNHPVLNGRFSAIAYTIDMFRMHLRMVDNNDLPIKGESLRMGIMADSSDVGQMAINLRLMIHNTEQGNSIILPSGGMAYRQIHRGTSNEGFRDDIDGILASIPKMEDSVKTAIAAAKENPVKGLDLSDDESVEKFAKVHGFSKKLMKRTVEILKTLKYGKQESTWAFVNSMTEAAQTLSLEERLEAEKQAGNLFMGATSSSDD